MSWPRRSAPASPSSLRPSTGSCGSPPSGRPCGRASCPAAGRTMTPGPACGPAWSEKAGNEPVGQTRVAVDIGTQFVKIVTVTGPGDAGRVRVRPVGPGGSRAVLTELAATGAEVCLAVPDAWLDGSAAGAREQEALRQLAEDELGLTGVRWAGQLAAVAALAASRGAVADERAAASEQAGGRYLIGDIGAAGVRVALCEVSVTPGPGYAVRQVAVHAAQGGGWQDLNVAVRAALGADADPGLGTW